MKNKKKPETTTIQIENNVWKWLTSLKRPGESFQEVLLRLKKMITHYKLKHELEAMK